MLADHGADVIKVEPPTGELARGAYPLVEGESIYFATHNRGKRSVALNLKSADGLAALRALIANADVLLTNYADGVPDRLGFGYAAVAELNPSLVMTHITGFGPDADWAPPVAFDGVIQAMSGIADLTGHPGSTATFSGVFPADHLASYHAVLGTMLALRERSLTGTGQLVPVSMLDSYQTLMAHEVGLVAEGTPSTRVGNTVPGAFADVFPARDGAVFISPLGQPTWERFWSALGERRVVEEVAYADSLGSEYEDLRDTVVTWVAEHSVAEVCAVMNEARVPHGPMTTAADAVTAMAQPHRDRIREVTTPSGRRVSTPAPPLRTGLVDHHLTMRIPAIGEHTAEVLEPVLEPDLLMRVLEAADSV
ncbi:crotonobetainyl-CoA:carnitine CoA-transferase CaiB-like acyl-CoA transferase [Nocardioides albus]|uniref:Crotonobetainyl-CoA:carnitine CoA-transferase CaiB-like acyl-CoA transferase n=2 Tax=Nocardioides albus TaxID=1841 RepID=A0A7W5A498_9ACTN|nr:crotonobetainyl-CoA:carnitine CoA-transferase CaiB-like acyl-CoA transferase [Nocardioides albus]